MSCKFDHVRINAEKVTAWTYVNLDDDGTPLDIHGERMVEYAPGQWTEALIAEALGLIERDD